MGKIGFVGGTFNPIHNGHLLLAEWAKDQFELDEILMMPTGISYLKADTEVLCSEERFHMVELAVENNPCFTVSDIEIKREGYTYTYETLEQLRRERPEDTFYFICGADCLFFIDKWKNVERLFANCVLVGAVRGDASMEQLEQKRKELLEKFDADIRIMPFLNYSVSSSEIRQRVAEGKSIRYLVPEKVREYIEDKGFYRG